MPERLILAIPGGRIFSELRPLLPQVGIEPPAALDDPYNRQLLVATQDPCLSIIQVRSFDVATFVAFGAAQLGIVGNDVITEFNYSEIYAPVDLGIARCRLCVAEPTQGAPYDDPTQWSHIRIATKYPKLTQQHFAQRGVQAQCIKLHGAMEHAPSLGLCRKIVDLVQTGSTLKANNLVEVETILEVSSRLIVNRMIMKTRPQEIKTWIQRFNTLRIPDPSNHDAP